MNDLDLIVFEAMLYDPFTAPGDPSTHIGATPTPTTVTLPEIDVEVVSFDSIFGHLHDLFTNQ
jgi:hypothetical protein